ncbi:MAG: glycoside hydrolase family 2 protein, partial [Eubacteriales bacterium]
MTTRERIVLDGAWKGAYSAECDAPSCYAEAVAAGMKEIPAKVPGSLETDLEAAGILPEIFHGENVLKTYDYENVHYCLSRTFTYEPDDTEDVLVFEGIDCFAAIYVDGVKIGECDDMLYGREYPLTGLGAGEHELFVHIRPAAMEARKHVVDPSLFANEFNFDSLYVRKAPHMYGWDIMPRIVSCGIWKHVYVERRPKYHIDDVFFCTQSCNESAAHIRTTVTASIGNANVHDRCFLKFTGACGDSRFEFTRPMRHSTFLFDFDIRNPKLWFPHNYGEPNLYTVIVELYVQDKLCESREFTFGVRTVELERTSTTDQNGNGEFCFRINGKKVFAMGTNWVPVDAIHARDEERLPKILPMLTDLGCNIVRCWGGNVYENDLFYNYCDAHGIMVWQDFAMACALYPQDEYFQNLLRREVEAVVRRLRTHACIILWSGDNECDFAYLWSGVRRDPNTANVLTRRVIPDVLNILDLSRPYLPSSPYLDEDAFRSGGQNVTSEGHPWGPRDYFKGDFYRNIVCHFASEIGYHGCPSPESLAKYIDEEHLWPCLGDRQWLVHAATMTGEESHQYGYRIRLMWTHVETLFGKNGRATSNLRDFSRASQISQAEAKKYFIERFRLAKWRRTGIIWWNLIDGWPQISDAIVDYYYDKKLAYDYIKR